MTVTAISLPTIKDSLKSYTTARSATIVHGSFITARAMAVAKGLPCGILIERRGSKLTTEFKKDANNRRITDYPPVPKLADLNYSSQMSYVQVPSKISLNGGIYPYKSLVNPTNNCTKRYYYYVKRSDCELLYAAATGQKICESSH